MSHLIEENTNLVVLIVNSISILFLVILAAFGKNRDNPFVMFIKGLFANILLFLALFLIVVLAYPELAMIAILMLQLLYFPITGILLLFMSICIDVNWTKKNWKYMLFSFVFLFSFLLLSIIYTVSL